MIAWGSGQVTLTNCVITGADRGVNSDGSATVTLTNCTLDDNRIGIYGHNGPINIRNTIISNSIDSGIYNILSSPITMRYSNVWSTSGLNYRGNISNQTGLNGNLSVNPLYKNAATGSYQLQYRSPMIDAADGALAPATDLMGAPRYDDPRTTNTGIATAGGAFADMGAFEFAETASSDIDMVIGSGTGPVTGTSAIGSP